MSNCKECGHDRFRAHQKCFHEITVDSDNDWVSSSDIYYSGIPYGPYTCLKCGNITDELPEK